MSGHELESNSLHQTTPCRTEPLPSETVERCAQLLATGEMDWPEGLSAEQEAELMATVRRLRRARLVKLIASRIAADLASAAVRERAQEAQE